MLSRELAQKLEEARVDRDRALMAIVREQFARHRKADAEAAEARRQTWERFRFRENAIREEAAGLRSEGA